VFLHLVAIVVCSSSARYCHIHNTELSAGFRQHHELPDDIKGYDCTDDNDLLEDECQDDMRLVSPSLSSDGAKFDKVKFPDPFMSVVQLS